MKKINVGDVYQNLSTNGYFQVVQVDAEAVYVRAVRRGFDRKWTVTHPNAPRDGWLRGDFSTAHAKECS